MRVLILSCNTGEGHNSAAAALREQFEAAGDRCDIADALALCSPTLSKLVCGAHSLFYRAAPALYGALYRQSERRAPKLGGIAGWGVQGLRQRLLRGQYDALICVHVFGALIADALADTGFPLPPRCFLATDWTCSPCVGETQADRYFIPDARLAPEFEAAGVPAEKLCAAGIPLRGSIRRSLPKKEARRRLGLPETGGLILLAGGSMGCGPLKSLCRQLARQLPEGAHAVVLCGRNRALQKQLAPLEGCGILAVGYTSRMGEYLDAADVLVTKPGGITVSEALAKGLPLVCIDAVPGCESRNLAFLLRDGRAAVAKRPRQLAQLACGALRPPQRPARPSGVPAEQEICRIVAQLAGESSGEATPA